MHYFMHFRYFFQSVSLLIVGNSLPSSNSMAMSSASLSRLQELRPHSEGQGGALGSSASGYQNDLEGGIQERHPLLSNGGCIEPAPASVSSGAAANKSYVQVARLKLDLYVAEVRQFLGSRSCNFLLLNALSTGIVNQIFETYLFISLEESIHASKGFGGLCTCIGSFSCAPVFYYSGQWIEVYGHGQCILVAESIYAMRLLLLALSPYDWAYSKEALLVQHLLHGPSFALFWATSVDAIFKQSPKHLGASCMGVLNMFFNTLGACIGSLLWGYLYEWCGGMAVSFYTVAILLQCATVYYCSQHTSDLDLALASKKDKDHAEYEGDRGRESDDESGHEGHDTQGQGQARQHSDYDFERSRHSSHSRHSRKPHVNPSIGVS